ncbi:MAG: hypothetical protein QHH07_01395 [Sedimentisphaerales bacterium]|jgi:hypothetical protein|nr:hypothetical protein [Sedimentisphaerales bacterium]
MPCYDVRNLIALSLYLAGKIPDVNVPKVFLKGGAGGKYIIKSGLKPEEIRIGEGNNYITMDSWVVQVGRDLVDVDEDGKFDEKDVEAVENEVGYEGPNRADIASWQKNPFNPSRQILLTGVPDEKVTADADLAAITAELQTRGK